MNFIGVMDFNFSYIFCEAFRNGKLSNRTFARGAMPRVFKTLDHLYPYLHIIVLKDKVNRV